MINKQTENLYSFYTSKMYLNGLSSIVDLIYCKAALNLEIMYLIFVSYLNTNMKWVKYEESEF